MTSHPTSSSSASIVIFITVVFFFTTVHRNRPIVPNERVCVDSLPQSSIQRRKSKVDSFEALTTSYAPAVARSRVGSRLTVDEDRLLGTLQALKQVFASAIRQILP